MSRQYKGRSSSPRNKKRGCLCRDGSYSRDCCDGTYFAQGVGNVTKTETTYTEETIEVPITYEEMVSELQPDEKRELLEAMKENNENGQFDTSIAKLESGQRIILATYSDGTLRTE